MIEQTLARLAPPPRPAGRLAARAAALRTLLVRNLYLLKNNLRTQNSIIQKATASTTVQINRDDKGVWFITGADDAPLKDVSHAMGYAVATDRLWQLEMSRRMGTGRLAEIFGKDLLEVDKLERQRGYSDDELNSVFNSMETEVQDIIQGYADGINQRLIEIESDPVSLLPFEFVVLGIPLEPWTANQILAWTACLQRRFDAEAYSTQQLENTALILRLIRSYGEESAWKMFNDLRWTHDPAAITTIDYGKTQQSHESDQYAKPTRQGNRAYENSKWSSEGNFRGTKRSKMINGASTMEYLASEAMNTMDKALGALQRLHANIKLGSYAWVVSGNFTESGYPTLYGATQLGFDAMAIPVEGSIQAGGLSASGQHIPGVPGIFAVVRTPYNAWAMETGCAHTTDYYFEDNSTVALHRVETIRVAGEEDIELPIYRGRGPVVGQLGDQFIVWKYSHWNYEFQTISSVLKMVKATSIDEFEVGVNGLGISVHICYADRDGNIAYWMAGRNPVRSQGEWRLPQGFLEKALEWDAAVVHPVPTDRNTLRGWYSQWNIKPNADYLTGFNSAFAIQGPFHRVHAINDYLDEESGQQGRLSFEQIRGLALNIAVTDSNFGGGTPWFLVSERFRSALNTTGMTGIHADALQPLESWDGKFVAGGKAFWINATEKAEAWVLTTEWISEVLKMVFFDELAVPDEEGNLKLLESDNVLFNALLHGLEYPGSLTNSFNWFQNLLDPAAPQDADTIIRVALDKVLAGWESFDFSRGFITHNHVFLGELWRSPHFSRGTYNQVVEMGPDGPARIESLFPLGQSGHIGVDPPFGFVFDPNFLSMTPLFDNFVHRQFPLFD